MKKLSLSPNCVIFEEDVKPKPKIYDGTGIPFVKISKFLYKLQSISDRWWWVNAVNCQSFWNVYSEREEALIDVLRDGYEVFIVDEYDLQQTLDKLLGG
jgi:hypothetical protein